MTSENRDKDIERPVPGYEGLLLGMIQRAAADRFIRVLDGYQGRKMRNTPGHKHQRDALHKEANAFFLDGRFQYWCDLAGWKADAIVDRLKRERDAAVA